MLIQPGHIPVGSIGAPRSNESVALTTATSKRDGNAKICGESRKFGSEGPGVDASFPDASHCFLSLLT
jgi:hypothetical protein